MRIAVFDTRSYDRAALERANVEYGHELVFLEPRLTRHTARLATGFTAVCSFVNDELDATCLGILNQVGVRHIALRSAGYNHVDLEAARALDLVVTRVPEYSPFAVAEHAAALILALNRKVHRAYNRVREMNFSLDGLVGFDLHGKTVGVIGTGRIGLTFARIMRGFGCKLLAYDKVPNAAAAAELAITYVPLDELLAAADIVSLHVPLTPATHHLLDGEAFARMRAGVMLVNTGRGALIDTHALIASLKTGHLGSAALDVYEEEEGVFFRDLSGTILQDDMLARLLTFPNVIVTAHQGFLTYEALREIARTTLASVSAVAAGDRAPAQLTP